MIVTTHVKKLIQALVLSLTLFYSTAYAELAIIVHPNNTINNLTIYQVKQIFLGHNKNFPNGKMAIPIDQEINSKSRFEFYAKVIKKTSAELKSYWASSSYTGIRQPPTDGGTDNQIKDLISENPSFIGYIDSSMIDDHVKVILKIK